MITEITEMKEVRVKDEELGSAEREEVAAEPRRAKRQSTFSWSRQTDGVRSVKLSPALYINSLLARQSAAKKARRTQGGCDSLHCLQSAPPASHSAGPAIKVPPVRNS